MRADERSIIISDLEIATSGGEIVLRCRSADGAAVVLHLSETLAAKLAADLKARPAARPAGQECLHPDELNASNDD